MTIDSDTAANVAARHGLGLPDAQALTVLAEGEAHAEQLAERFAADRASKRDRGTTDGQPSSDRGIDAGREKARQRHPSGNRIRGGVDMSQTGGR